MAELKTKLSGQWVNVPEILTKSNGQWRTIVEGYTKVGGIWSLMYANERVLTVLSDTSNINIYDMYTQQYGEPSSATRVRLIVASGVLVSSTSSSEAAIKVDNRWPDGVMVTIENHGMIVGRGGDGGSSTPMEQGVRANLTRLLGVPGDNGGDAINAQGRNTENKLRVYNLGLIAGGGGGGGSGASANTDYFGGRTPGYAHHRGGGGGGGAGSLTSLGGDADDGWSPSSVNYLGTDGNPGSLYEGGAGGSGSRDRSLPLTREDPYISRESTGWGGKGGDLGKAGEDGRQGAVYIWKKADLYNTTGYWTIDGGRGGAAGMAVYPRLVTQFVNEKGNATSEKGDVRGGY